MTYDKIYQNSYYYSSINNMIDLNYTSFPTVYQNIFQYQTK